MVNTETISQNMEDTAVDAISDHNVAVSDMQELFGCTVRMCCRRTHTMPSLLQILDQNTAIRDNVSAINPVCRGRYVDLEVRNFNVYVDLILRGIYCPCHQVHHKVIPAYTEDKCLITVYNTPTKSIAYQKSQKLSKIMATKL